MPRFQHVRDSIDLSVKCPNCGEMTEKPLSWLVNEDVMPCGKCGVEIDFKSGDNGRRIQEVAREADRLHAILTKVGQGS